MTIRGFILSPWDRCARIINLLRQKIVVLATMAPADYHVVRTSSLGRGSGPESPGFAKLLAVGKPVWPAFEPTLTSRHLTTPAPAPPPPQPPHPWLSACRSASHDTKPADSTPKSSTARKS